MAKKQQIILLHGNQQLTANTANLVMGEVAVYNAPKAEDVELYATGADNNLAVFQTAAKTQAGIQAVKDLVDDLKEDLGLVESGKSVVERVETLEQSATTLDAAIKAEVERATGAETDLNTAITDEASRAKRIEEGLSGRIKAVEDDYLKAADKAELNNAITAETANRESAITEVKGLITDETNRATAAETALTQAIKGVDERLKTAEGEIDALQGATAGFSSANTIDAAVKAAKTEVKLAENEEILVLTEAAGTDGHVIYTLNTKDVASASGVSALAQRVTTVEGQVTTLIGDDANKSVRTIANEELAAQLLGETAADDNFKTLQELAAWLEEHPEDAAEMNQKIADLEKVTSGYTGVNAIKTAVEGVDDKIDQEITDRQNAITDVTAAYEAADAAIRSALTLTATTLEEGYMAADSALTQSIEGIDKRVDDLEALKVVETIVVTNKDERGIALEKSGTTYTFNFDAMVIDGGRYDK